MPLSQAYLDYVVDQLKALGAVTAQRMFGGAGLYHRGTFFGLVADDVLYFKVGDANRKDYLDAGAGPFKPFGSYAMDYYEVPADVLEDADQLAAWAKKAIDVKGKARSRSSTAGKKKTKKQR
jgi:DNA transformation protein